MVPFAEKVSKTWEKLVWEGDWEFDLEPVKLEMLTKCPSRG